MRAFNAAKTMSPDRNLNDDIDQDDYVSLREFKYLLMYLQQYYQYWVIFEEIDHQNSQGEDDRRISLEEFKQSLPLLKKYGIEDPETAFHAIDTDQGGFILFDEFCEWAIKHKVSLEDSVAGEESSEQDENAVLDDTVYQHHRAGSPFNQQKII